MRWSPSIRRLSLIAPALALAACATTEPATHADVVSLRAELRALRESNTRLEQRVERVELQQAVLMPRAPSSPRSDAAPRAASSNALAAQAPAPAEIPELAVVKVKPKHEPAPKIATVVPVVEPSPEILEALAQGTSGGDDDDGDEAPSGAEKAAGAADQSLLEVQFQHGLEALRTGNVEGGVTKLQRFAQDNPHHAKADNALYFAGVGQIGLADHAAAAATFELLIQRYPAGDAVVDAMLKLAECRVRLNQKKDARSLYSQVISHYPGTAAATQAEARLSSLLP